VPRLDHASVLVNDEESAERRAALLEALSNQSGGSKFLRSSKSNELVSVASAFTGALTEAGTLFDGLEPNGPAKKIKLRVQYASDTDHFLVDTALGPIRVEAIVFFGEIRVLEKLVPLTVTAEYRRTETGECISQVASFAPQEVNGMNFSLEMHRIAATGETNVIMRRLADPK
jgi:hypothetical protein